MKLCVIGFGQAGGKILDRFIEYDGKTKQGIITDVFAINTAEADLLGLKNVPENRRILIGADKLKGGGVGADNERGAEIAKENLWEIIREINDAPINDIDAFLIIAGLGGGTGSGGAPVLAEKLSEQYREPVYGFGVIPANNESGLYTMNASRSLKTFVDKVDSLILFDNDNWRETEESVASGYERINNEIVIRLGVLFGAGIVEDSSQVGESVVDASEIINTLECGGIASIGYASEELQNNQGLLSRFQNSDNTPNKGEGVNRITSLTRKASLGRLTLPGDISSTQKALVIVAGPKEELNRKGIEKSRKWVEETAETMEVRGGDYPLEENKIASTVLFSGLTDSQRVKELQKKAVETKNNIESIREESEENLEDLIQDDDDKIDELF